MKKQVKQVKQGMKSVKLEAGLYFPSDFKALPRDAIIYIKSGTLVIPNRRKR